MQTIGDCVRCLLVMTEEMIFKKHYTLFFFYLVLIFLVLSCFAHFSAFLSVPVCLDTVSPYIWNNRVTYASPSKVRPMGFKVLKFCTIYITMVRIREKCYRAVHRP